MGGKPSKGTPPDRRLKENREGERKRRPEPKKK